MGRRKQEYKVDVNGTIRTVDLEMLRAMVLSHFVKSDTCVWIDGAEWRVADIAEQIAKDCPWLNPGGPAPPPRKRIPMAVKQAIALAMCLPFVIGFLYNAFPEKFHGISDKIHAVSERVGVARLIKGGEKDSVSGKTGDEGSGEEPFDSSVKKLPSNFKGNDFLSIFQGFEDEGLNIPKLKSENKALNENARIFEKEEFETSEEFSARTSRGMEKNSKHSVYKKIRFDSKVAFVLPREAPKDGEDIYTSFNVKYDADSSEWNFNIDFAGGKPEEEEALRNFRELYQILGEDREGKTWYDYFPLVTSNIEIGSYEAKNAFNASFTVQTLETHSKGIYFIIDLDPCNLFARNPLLKITDVPRDFAKKASETVGVLIACRLRYDPIVANHEENKPTIDVPFKFFRHEEGMLVWNVEFWIYDQKSGDVYAKFSAEDVGKGKNEISYNSIKSGDAVDSEKKETTPSELPQNPDDVAPSESEERKTETSPETKESQEVSTEPSEGEKEETKQKEENKETEEDVVEEPFDKTVDRLPADFKGNNLSSIFKGYEDEKLDWALLDKLFYSKNEDSEERQDNIFVKNEYETTDAYNERRKKGIAENSKKIVCGNVRFDSYVAFVLPRKQNPTTPFANYKPLEIASFDAYYDADSQKWSLEIDTPEVPSQAAERQYEVKGGRTISERDGDSIWFLYPVTEKIAGFSGYETNGICVKTNDQSVRATRLPSLILTGVPADVAKEYSQSAALALVGRLQYAPIVKTLGSSKSLTGTKRAELSSRAICLEELEFWVFNSKTGEILAKYPFEVGEYNLTKQYGSTNSGNAASDAVHPKYSTEPFDVGARALPENYYGHDPTAVLRGITREKTATLNLDRDIRRSGDYRGILEKLEKDKKDYAQYKDYYESLALKTLVGERLKDKTLFESLRFDSNLAFVLPNDSELDDEPLGKNKESVHCDYDEASKVMTITRSFRTFHEIEYPKYDEFPLSFVCYTLGKSSKTSFSAKGDTIFALALKYEQRNKKAAPKIEKWKLVDVDKEDFERVKDSVRVLCVCNLDDDGDMYYGLYSPDDYELICAAKPEFWIYDGKTGKILAKFTAAETFNGARKKQGEVKLGSVEGRDGGTAGDSAKEDGDELIEAPPTWEETLAKAVETPETWETKEAAITIPDDAATLREALAKAKKGDVVRIRKGTTVKFDDGKAKFGEKPRIAIDRAIAIVGETDSPSDATIQFGEGEAIEIASGVVAAFKGVAFVGPQLSPGGKSTPLIAAGDGSTAKFRHCSFNGIGAKDSVGAEIKGKSAKASFWRCEFRQFDGAGTVVDESASASFEFCEFLSGNRSGVSAFSASKVKVQRCRFDGNEAGFRAEGGGGVVASYSFFSKNSVNWYISTGSARACDTKEGVVVEK